MSICRTLVRRTPYAPSRIKDLCLIISFLSVFYLLLHRPPNPSTTLAVLQSQSPTTSIATTIRHLLFAIASSSKSYPNRKPYLRLWYTPLSTRAFLFLDRPTPDSDPSLPPIVISGDTSQFPYSFPHGIRSAIRVARIIKEAVNLNESDVRWYIFGDDDTVFFADNLVKTLSKYDHDQWYYVGSSSESYEQNEKHSFDMAFGGGGFAISYSLARVLGRVIDSCIMRYPHVYGGDSRTFSCLMELGVQLTHEPGFHQVDVRGDLFGMLSAHPLSPLVSLHHLDLVEPIFPGMSRLKAVEHLFEAVKADPTRILQQTVCYDCSNSFTVSVAWGYVVPVFEGNQLLPDLLPLQRTFSPWRRNRNAFSSHYMFNTRDYPNDTCKRPVAFFLESVVPDMNGLYTFYTRHIPENCLKSKVIQSLEHIRVVAKKADYDPGQMKAPRRQCCDILPSFNKTMVIAIRQCKVDELISMRA